MRFTVGPPLFPVAQGINRCLCVCNKQILNCLHRAKALNYGGYLEACLLKLGLPGAVLVTCHIVIGVVACNDHQRTQNNLLIAACLNGCDYVIEGRSCLKVPTK